LVKFECTTVELSIRYTTADIVLEIASSRGKHVMMMCATEGAVCYGLEPGVVTTRRSALTYGVEVLHRFDAERHPISRKVHKDGVDWCTGVFDTFVHANQVWILLNYSYQSISIQYSIKLWSR